MNNMAWVAEMAYAPQKVTWKVWGTNFCLLEFSNGHSFDIELRIRNPWDAEKKRRELRKAMRLVSPNSEDNS
jgi:hypothetical protein